MKIAFIEYAFCVHVESISLVLESLESVFAVSEGMKIYEIADTFCILRTRRIFILGGRIVGIRVCCE